MKRLLTALIILSLLFIFPQRVGVDDKICEERSCGQAMYVNKEKLRHLENHAERMDKSICAISTEIKALQKSLEHVMEMREGISSAVFMLSELLVHDEASKATLDETHYGPYGYGVSKE